ncbi:MAG TPA: bifunctional rhamnulose-1-phosphate aldolase/short-chain dehydrogenase [Vicinamibacteria bacterium]|nr:bifunctional rhamnulose-1-phosphate aldolase/short-chain dehydrogenase [Vicinamibacteria bacterium]
MHTARTADRLPDLWEEARASGMSEPERLLYRSNLLGSDLRVTNFGGGNTSAKVLQKDPLTGEDTTVLWVKGSGGDLGSMGLDGFATLCLERLSSLRRLYRGREHEDEMVGYLPHCTFGLNPRAASIDTPLHAFIPHAHVDHLHPDAVIAIATAKDGERLTADAFGGRLGWLPWQRPGFDLGLKLEQLARSRPDLDGVVLGGHGLFTWGDTARACYGTTLRVIQQAADYLAARGRSQPFGAPVARALSPSEKTALLAALAPRLRGRLSAGLRKVMHFADGPEVMEFVSSSRAEELAALGTSCPDHFLRTKIWPLFVPFDPASDTASDLGGRVEDGLERYRRRYAAYYQRCRRADSPAMRDPWPVIVLVPALGLLAFAGDKATARVASEFYVNAIGVMRGAESVSSYQPIAEQEAFDVEYWALEEAKLRRLPGPKSLAGKVAVVTGGAGGIGGATARRLLAEGACVVVTDKDAGALEEARLALEKEHGKDRVAAFRCDVTDEASVVESYRRVACEFGGLDILVSNAGIASAAPVEETSLELWNRNLGILATGYFLVAREAFLLMKSQGLGGSLVFIGSKNALVASAGASAYCSAKAAAVHLARCLALEGAELGIRANVVNPDAVIRGSRIWAGSWRQERAEANRISEAEIEEFYRGRSLMKRSVLPEDVAEAVLFFAGEASAKSTGNILNVDAGNVASFTR